METLSLSQLVLKTRKTNSLNVILSLIGKNIVIYILIYKDTKLRQVLFRLLHRITVTIKELFKFQLVEDKACILYLQSDSIEHAFVDWYPNNSLFLKSHVMVQSWKCTDITLSNKKNFQWQPSYIRGHPLQVQSNYHNVRLCLPHIVRLVLLLTRMRST